MVSQWGFAMLVVGTLLACLSEFLGMPSLLIFPVWTLSLATFFLAVFIARALKFHEERIEALEQELARRSAAAGEFSK
jgi:hypothetical protein